jgi:hypothetical protein
MSDTVVIKLRLHGERVWRRIGERQAVRADGKATKLAIWASTCLVCGRPFEVTVPATSGRAASDAQFTLISCEQHRLTRADRGRLFQGPDERRRLAFEKIKAEKLGLVAP